MTTLAVLGSLAATIGIGLLLWSNIVGNRENARAHEDLERSVNRVERSVNERVDGVERSINERIDGVERSINERVDGVERSVNDLSERVDGVERSVDDLRTEMRQGFDRLSEQIAGSRNPPGEGSAAGRDD